MVDELEVALNANLKNKLNKHANFMNVRVEIH